MNRPAMIEGSAVIASAIEDAEGFFKALVPVEFGGGGQRWETAYKVVREIARADVTGIRHVTATRAVAGAHRRA